MMHKILIVSGDDFLRDLFRLSLAGMQVEIRFAANAGQMEQLCRRVLFDLVVVLNASTLLDGRDVVRLVRPEGLRRPVFYVVSWQQSEQTVLSLLESGVDQYLTFPLSLHRLRTKIANELTRQL